MDHQRALIVGEISFGKGSVNTLKKISDGSGIYFTIARWYTPNGNLIEGKGVIPDVVISEMEGAQETEDALDVALDIMKNQILLTK